jgi:cyclophilin family peptidyl-prolyl cis-trans isomerase
MPILLIILLAVALPLAAENGAPLHKKVVLSKVYTIDKIYKSMEGPSEVQNITLSESGGRPELLWVKSVRVDIVGEDGKTPARSEFMCHMNIDLDPNKHQTLLATPYPASTRLLTLSQGVFEGRVPEGYGYPVVSIEPLIIFTQVLNHNIANPGNVKVRHRVTIEYLRDAELKEPMKPLVNIGASGMTLLTGNDPNKTMPSMGGMTTSSTPTLLASSAMPADGMQHGPSCLISPRAPNAILTSDYTDPQGRKLTGHWIVPPGRQVNASDITWFMGLPFDTRLHFALAHLHPFAESLTLRDTTTGQDLWIARTSAPKKGIGLAHVDDFESDKGIPLYKDHKYELISVYDNKLKVNVDSMASMFFGFDDPAFKHPDPVQLAARASDLLDSDTVTVVIRTTDGDFAARLYRELTPLTVRQFIRMVRAGVFDHAKFTTIDDSRGAEVAPGDVSAEQKQLANAPLEMASKHQPGTLSYCPGDVGFSIVLGMRPLLDRRCTAFGQIGPGAEVIRTMVDAPRDAKGVMAKPVEITKIELLGSNDVPHLNAVPPKPVASLR